ncbi:hypothetical protein ABZZ16_42660, partial [Streptomyces sp. NPDC006386]|uniref:hypothetical protein n=1 Tax=Streptomyces sp. NPDC006386 TaxID=3156762 RepID=UPI0033BE9C5B
MGRSTRHVVRASAQQVVTDPAARQVAARVDGGRHITASVHRGGGGHILADPSHIAKVVVQTVAQADVLPRLFRGVGARADQGRFVGGGVHARGVRVGGRVARVGLVDDVAGAVGGFLQDVA